MVCTGQEEDFDRFDDDIEDSDDLTISEAERKKKLLLKEGNNSTEYTFTVFLQLPKLLLYICLTSQLSKIKNLSQKQVRQNI